jgi:hypothetical protein
MFIFSAMKPGCSDIGEIIKIIKRKPYSYMGFVQRNDEDEGQWTSVQTKLYFTNTLNTNIELQGPDNFMALRNDYNYHIHLVCFKCFKKFPLAEFPWLWNDFESDEIKSNGSRTVI